MMNILSYLENTDGFIRMAAEGFCDKDIGVWHELPNKVSIRQTAPAVIEVKPAQSSDSAFVYSCGVHGNETAPIEIISKILSEIVLGQLQPTSPILFVLGNPNAMNIADRFVSINMNRLFAGAWQSYENTDDNAYELARAEELEIQLTRFFASNDVKAKYHFDCHTAIKPSYHKTFAIRPWQQSAIGRQSLELLGAMGIEAILQHNKPSTTFSYYSVEAFGAEAYTLELGKVMPFGQNKIEDFEAVASTLRTVILGKSLPEVSNSNPKQYKVVAEIIKHSDEFKMLVDDNAPNFTPYPQGTLLASDRDYEYRVAYAEEAVVFPNVSVPIGQRVAVIVSSA